MGNVIRDVGMLNGNMLDVSMLKVHMANGSMHIVQIPVVNTLIVS